MPITPEISAKLLELKEESGLTFEQIGAEVGTSDANARRYIKGETKTPDRQLLYAIVRCIGGDPDELFEKKPLPQQALSGMDPLLYDKLTANFEARYSRQQQLHQENLAKWHEKHEKEVAALQATMEQTIRSKDQWIEKLKAERDGAASDLLDAKQTVRHLTIALVVLVALLGLLVVAYLVRDVFDGSWGYIRY